MGKLPDGLNGPMRGKTKNVVGRKTKHGNVISAISTKPLKPATEDQRKVRDEFSLMSWFLSYISDVVKTGFKNYSRKMSPMNAAISYNLKHGIKKSDAGLEIDFPKIVFSRGPLTEPEEPALKAEAGGKIIVSWIPEQEDTAYNAETDLVTIVMCNPARERFNTRVGGAIRADGLYILEVPAIYAGDLIHIYISFISLNDKVSDSVYIGNIVLLGNED